MKDKAGAEKAKPKLEALSKQFVESATELMKRPKPDVEAAFKAQTKKFDPNSVMGAYNRLTDRAPAAAEVLAEVPLVKYMANANEGRVRADTQVIIKGLQTYYTQNGRWPARLADMANLFEKGADAFKDPWGNEYKFEIGTKTLPDGMVVEAPYVWAERKVGDQVKVIGTKPVKKQ